MNTKICYSCKIEKPATTEYFNRRAKSKDGLNYQCKECALKEKKEWKKKNPDKVREQRKRYRERHPDRYREQKRASNKAYKTIRRHRKRSGGTISFTSEDIEIIYAAQEGLCLYCQKELGEDFHIDHFIPLSKNGTNGRENIVCACPTCNASKNALLPNEWPGWNGAYPYFWGEFRLEPAVTSGLCCPRCGATLRQVKAGFTKNGKQIHKCQLCKRVYTTHSLREFPGFYQQLMQEYLRGEYLIDLEKKYGISRGKIERWAEQAGIKMTSTTRKLVRFLLGKSY